MNRLVESQIQKSCTTKYTKDTKRSKFQDQSSSLPFVYFVSSWSNSSSHSTAHPVVRSRSRRQVVEEPLAGQPGDFLEGARLGEQMGGAGDDVELAGRR